MQGTEHQEYVQAVERNRSSTTAQLTTFARTAHFKQRGPIKGTDHLAERFLDPLLKVLAKSQFIMNVARRRFTRNMPGTWAFVLARTLFFDEVFARELKDGARQIVLLGAGFDSRAYRFANECRERAARVFEVDFPTTSAAKQAKIKKVFGESPAHVRYVPSDFNTTALAEPLLAAGYDPTLRTLFVWEGVSGYLSEAAVDAVLRFVVTQSHAGSAVVFDYLDARMFEPSCDLWGVKEIRKELSRLGEPIAFGIHPDQLSTFLRERGLVCDQDLQPSDIEQRYLVRPDGTLFDRVAGCYRMAVARR